MSNYYGSAILRVRGNADTLKAFATRFDETEEEDAEMLIEKRYTDKGILYELFNEAEYWVDYEGYSGEFPTLKFEYIFDSIEQGSSYTICLNGKELDYKEGNPYALRSDPPVDDNGSKCTLCKREFEDGICGDNHCPECDHLIFFYGKYKRANPDHSSN